MDIKINEPCHENWDAMTPNTQGAFCKSCKKDVIDFSQMGVAQIKDFFAKPQSARVCGRFEEKQLQELSFDDFFARFRYWNFSRKFAVIFVLAFGFWLFSSNAVLAQNQHYLKGEVAIMPDKPAKKDTVKKQTVTQPVKTDRVIMGKVKCVKPVQKEEEPVKEPIKVKEPVKAAEPEKVKQEHMVMGMIAYIPPKEEKVIQKPLVPQTKTEVADTTQLKNDNMVIGVVIANPGIDEVKQQPKIEVIDVVKNKPAEESQLANESKVLVYPNPSNGYFTIESKEKQTLHLTDDNGKLVLIQDVSVGNTAVDASHLRAGAYTLTLTGGAKIVVKKIIITR